MLGDVPRSDIDKYLLKGLSREEYDNLADELSETKAGKVTSNEPVIGYIAKNGKYIKYRLSDGLLVVYIKNKPNDIDQAISLYKVRGERFISHFVNSDKEYGYLKDLPENN